MFTLGREPSAEKAAGSHYALEGVGVSLFCEKPEDAAGVTELWRQLFVFDEVPSQEAGIHLHFGTRPLTPLEGEEVYHAPPLRVLKTGRGFFLSCGGSALDLELSKGLGTGYLDEKFFSRSVYHQREFFLLSLLMLLRPRGLYGLHANGLAGEHGDMLVIGKSGSGKTTLTLSLVRAGWRYGSDDATLLYENKSEGEGGVEARAFRRGFSCTDETVARFPELEEAPLLYRAQGKRVLDIGVAFPDGFAPSCRPRLLLFPQVAPQETSQLVPMSQTDALVALMQGSAGIMTDKAVSRVQLGVLKRLVETSSAYLFLSGRDVLEPDAESAVSTLLQRILQDPPKGRHG